MNRKKLMAVGVATVFALSSLSTTVAAADFNKANTGVTVKFTNPGKGKSKADDKKYKFNDLNDSQWALNAIEKLAGKGILGGIGQGKFAPRSNVTHIEALAMVLRLTGDDNEANMLGKKIHPKYMGVMPMWGYGYIYIAIEKGILLPEELKGFNPNQPAKRHEIAKYIIRAMGETKEALDNMDEDLDFKDASAIPDESIGYVYLANKLNIMVGDDNNKFSPNEPVTRAQMAVLLDRAEGKFDLPDSENRKNGTVFVSTDEDDNKITVKIKGVTTTFVYLDDINVYKNGDFMDIEDLEAGDMLQLTLNSSKKVIFIEVVKNAEDTVAEETSVSFAEMLYNNLPEEIQDEVDDLKADENYRAYEYGDYIYLLAAMGEKKTDGYDIDIEKITKTKDDDKYTIKASVDTDKPSSGSMTTQVITYPYTVVRFKSFDNISSVVFVDRDDDTLKKVSIKDIDEVEDTEDISFKTVEYDDLSAALKEQVDKLKLNQNYKAFEYNDDIYLIAAMGKKTADGYDIDIEDLEKVQDGSRYMVKAELAIEVPSKTTGSKTLYPYSIVKFSKFNNISKVRFVNEDGDKQADAGIVKIDDSYEVTGTINAIDTSKKTINVKRSNGSVITLSIPADADITINDDDNEDFSDLKVGMTVEIEIVDEVVENITAEDKSIEAEGELTGISIGTEDKVTVKIDGKNRTYRVGSNVEIIIDDEDDQDIKDLEIGDKLTLTFVNGALVQIEK